MEKKFYNIEGTLAEIGPVVEIKLQYLSDLVWMARRYADGRSTYAVSLYNDIVRSLVGRGVPLLKLDEGLWAKDGMFGYPRENVSD